MERGDGVVTYSVKECYFTLQGEGAQTGRAAVFLRFAGCNLWSGLEKDRAAAICNFCDTDFVGTDGQGGGKFAHADELATHVAAIWQAAVEESTGSEPYVVCTGGEPLLQLNEELIAALHGKGIAVGVETNGTLIAPDTVDWVCVSPKADAPLRQRWGDELKLVFPQDKAKPEAFAGLEFSNFFLQPMDGPAAKENLAASLDYCRRHPQWRLSIQTHKLIGIP